MRGSNKIIMKFLNISVFFNLLVVTAFYSNPSQAWHETGHMIVAEVAYKNLDQAIVSKIDDLVHHGMDEYPKSDSFVSVSPWADDIKVHGVNFYNNWHYQDTHFSNDGTKIPKMFNNGQAYRVLKTNLELFSSTKTTKSEKAFALRFIIHLYGDMHQPMHNVALVSQQFPRGDMGGNLFYIKHELKNLHSLWDSGLRSLPEFKRPLTSNDKKWISDYSNSLMASYPMTSFSREVITADFKTWQKEAQVIAEEQAYKNIKYKEQPSKEYLESNLPIVKQQLALAGYRLANELNCAMKSHLCIKK